MPRKAAPEPRLSAFEEEAAFRLKLATDFLSSVHDWRLEPDPAVVADSAEIPGIEDSYHLHEFAEEWFLCYGCKDPAEGGKLYCEDPLCQELGGFVRFVRKGLTEGRAKDPIFHDGIGQKLLSVLQGGYDPDRILSPALRTEILARDNRTCQLCQKPGNHVDHILGSSNDPSNLRVLCADCNMLRAFTPAVLGGEVIDDETKAFQEDVWLALVQRVGSEIPLLQLDRPDWASYSRKIAAHRRKTYQQRIEDDDAAGFE
jgi:hypothetical protein